MGMYDNLRCHYPLPIDSANDRLYQTKDLDCLMNDYEIREDGTLWHMAYDEPVEMTGEVRFYELLLEPGQDLNDHTRESGWIEWSAYFVKGKLAQGPHLIQHKLPGRVATEV